MENPVPVQEPEKPQEKTNFTKPIVIEGGMDHPSIKWVQESVIRKRVRVTLKDKRIYHGIFECTDNKGNLCLSGVCAEHIPEYSTELIEELAYFRPQPLSILDFIDFGEKKEEIEKLEAEKLEALNKEFAKNKYSFPNVVIPGHAVARIELQKFN